MKSGIAILIFILFAIGLNAQSDSISHNITNPTTLKRDSTLPRYYFSCPVIRCPAVTVQADSIPKPYTIRSEVTSQLGGLDFTRFRFDNKVNQMANMVGGVYSVDGSTPSIMGARPEGTAYYIDGVRVMDGFLPQPLQ